MFARPFILLKEEHRKYCYQAKEKEMGSEAEVALEQAPFQVKVPELKPVK